MSSTSDSSGTPAISSSNELGTSVINATTALTDESTTWVDTAPTSTVFSVGTDSATNHPGYDYVSYCFHAVDGFSRIGNFRGNGSQNGTYVYTGFSPMWVVVKNMSATYGWGMHDNVRDSINPVTAAFKASDTEAETTIASGTGVDFLSNGFKIRYSGGNSNVDGQYYMYWAIADRPFKYTNAR